MQVVSSQPAAMWRADAANSTDALGLPGACTGPVFSLCAINRLPESLVRRWLLMMFHGSQCEPVPVVCEPCGRGMGETTSQTLGGRTPGMGIAA